MLFDSHLTGAGEGMVVVVPSVAHRKKSEKVVIDAVVFDLKVLVTETGNVANDIENQRHIPSEETCQETSKHAFPTKEVKQHGTKQEVDGYAFCISQLPVFTLL